jgi:hypothetical protein
MSPTPSPLCARLAAVDMLIGNVQKFILSLAVERGFPASINGNG